MGAMHTPIVSPPPVGACGQSQAEPTETLTFTTPIDNTDLTIVYLNIRSYSKHRVELEARISQLPTAPSLIIVTESWLDRTIEQVNLTGYTVVARRDRNDGRVGGGVLVFSKKICAA